MQSQRGIVRRPTADDLTGKEGYLVILTHDTGVAEVRLPIANDEIPIYRVVNGAAAGEDVDLEPLDPETIQSLKLKGTCNPGDTLVLADVDVAADAGKVRTLPATAGVYAGLAVADALGVDGQLLRARPSLRLVHVASEAIAALGGDAGGEADGDLEDVSTAVTGVDGTGDNAASKADVDARLVAIANNEAELAASIEALRAAVEAHGMIAVAE